MPLPPHIQRDVSLKAFIKKIKKNGNWHNASESIAQEKCVKFK